MIKIAVVDDEAREREQVIQYFQQLSAEIPEELEVIPFPSGEKLLEKEEISWDIICLDIQMEGQDGIEIAKRIRERDQRVILIFITYLARMAIEGYAVRALDFMIKPVNYYSFALKMRNALKNAANNKSKMIVLSDEDGWRKFSTDELHYVEVNGHYIFYHTSNGTYRQKITLKKLEEKLEGLSFKRCNNCYLVNLKYVNAVRKEDVLVDDSWLKISRPRKKDFLQALAHYMGGLSI